MQSFGQELTLQERLGYRFPGKDDFLEASGDPISCPPVAWCDVGSVAAVAFHVSVTEITLLVTHHKPDQWELSQQENVTDCPHQEGAVPAVRGRCPLVS